MMKISAVNKATGELIELDVNTPEQVVTAWQVAQEYDKAATSLKEQLKKLVPSYVNDRGLSEPINDCQFRVNTIQRYTYDKSIMRRLLPEDDFDVLLKPDKTAVDKYLKEHIEDLGDKSTELRQNMVADGRPYQVIKLEKLTRG